MLLDNAQIDYARHLVAQFILLVCQSSNKINCCVLVYLKVVQSNISGWLELAIVLMKQIMPIVILMVEIVVIPTQTLTGAKIAFAMKIWIATVRLNWLEMASAMMKPIMKNVILMVVTVVGPVLIWNNALNVGVWLDPLQIINVSYLIERDYTSFFNHFEIAQICIEIYIKHFILELRF